MVQRTTTKLEGEGALEIGGLELRDRWAHTSSKFADDTRGGY